ncbi:MAG: NAD-dependent epimerase/dehydratase family protein [Alphaproteobacteria bacterium]
MTLSLVTGGSGFIGQHLVDHLILCGETVRILDIEPPPRRQPHVEYVQGSITDPGSVRVAMRGVRHLYHTAAIPHLWIADPSMFHETNVVGTEIVFDQALHAGVERIVHTSSATVLVDGRSDRRATTVDESRCLEEQELIGHYARSKWRAERVALGYADKLAVVVVMPTLPLGPGDRHFTPPSRMLLDFVNGRSLAYADCILNIIDVRDAAKGHYLACLRGRPGQRYILNRHSLAMADFLACLAGLTNRRMPGWKIPGSLALAVSAGLELWSGLVSGRAPIAPLAGVRASLRPIVFDGGRAQTELGLPMTALDDTLKDAVAWLASNGHPSGEGEDPAFAFGDR